MKRFITLILILLCFLSYGQEKEIFVGKIINDTNSFKKRTPYGGTLVPSILKSLNKIEIRLITSPSFSGSNFLIISYDTIWKVSKSSYNKSTNKYEITQIKPKYSIDSIFKVLVDHRIFSLINQNDLKMDEYTSSYNLQTDEFTGTGMGTGDGTVYTIEYKVGKYVRRYIYYNPIDYLEHYKLVPDLKEFVFILNTLNAINEPNE